MKVARNRVDFLVVASAVFLDQLFKFSAPRFGLTVVRNQGVAFGLWPHFSWGLVVFGLLLGLVIYLRKKSWGGVFSQRLGLMLILGGGLSNFFDRLFLGSIRDFIDLKVWPVFNLADVAITAGVILLLVGEVKGKTPKRKDGN